MTEPKLYDSEVVYSGPSGLWRLILYQWNHLKLNKKQ